MLDWLSERLLSILHAVPPIFGADAPHSAAARAFAAPVVITLAVYVIATRPFSPFIACFRNLFGKGSPEKSDRPGPGATIGAVECAKIMILMVRGA
jgi:hypothetical protein